MKFSLFTNDKSSARDEWILALLIAVVFAAGLMIYLYVPAFWVIGKTTIKAFGIFWMIVAVTFVPALVYRLLTNKKE